MTTVEAAMRLLDPDYLEERMVHWLEEAERLEEQYERGKGRSIRDTIASWAKRQDPPGDNPIMAGIILWQNSPKAKAISIGQEWAHRKAQTYAAAFMVAKTRAGQR